MNFDAIKELDKKIITIDNLESSQLAVCTPKLD
jgi:hypothetical protein